MRKEIFFAILAGALFGLVIAFGIWRANSSMKSNNGSSDVSVVEESPTASPKSEVGLTLAKPENLTVTGETPITLNGITEPNNWIAISAEDDDYVFQADANGAFEKDIDLVGGANVIVITSIDKDGNTKSTKLTIVYSSEFNQ